MYTEIVSDYDSDGNYYSYYSNDGEESVTGGTAAANGLRKTGYTWAMVLGGMALLATGVAAVAHATVRPPRVQFISNFTFVLTYNCRPIIFNSQKIMTLCLQQNLEVHTHSQAQ